MSDRRHRTVYLIHFERPIGTARKTAQHYIGMVFGGLPEVDARLQAHRAGQGAAITAHAAKMGISMVLARTWERAPFGFEAACKAAGGANRRLCPVCTGRVSDTRRMLANVRRANGAGYHIGFRNQNQGESNAED